jgi:hypothetical protein
MKVGSGQISLLVAVVVAMLLLLGGSEFVSGVGFIMVAMLIAAGGLPTFPGKSSRPSTVV